MFNVLHRHYDVKLKHETYLIGAGKRGKKPVEEHTSLPYKGMKETKEEDQSSEGMEED